MSEEQEGTVAAGNDLPQEGTTAENGNNREIKAPGWIAGLPEGMRAQAAEAGFSKVGDLWEAYAGAQEQLSRAVVKPGEDADDETLASYRQALGVPPGPEAYVGGESLGEYRAQELRETAHKAGLSQEQYQKLVTAEVERKKSLLESRQDTEKQMRQQYGASFESKLNKARRIVTHFGDSDFDSYLAEHDLNTDPRMIKTFIRIADAFGEHSLPDSGTKPAVDPRKERAAFLKKLYPSLAN